MVLPQGTRQPPELRARGAVRMAAVRGAASLPRRHRGASVRRLRICSLRLFPAARAALGSGARAGAGGYSEPIPQRAPPRLWDPHRRVQDPVPAPVWGSLLLVVLCLLARPDRSSRCSRAGTVSGTGWQRSSELHPRPQPQQPRLSLSWRSISQSRICQHLPTRGSILHLPGSLCPTPGSRAGIVTLQSCPGIGAHRGAHRTKDHRGEAGGLWDHL